ncbi:DMT family transporter [Aquirufa sp.]|jgi:drug/metabolite transporter (DMT)-like permease|uniref:DMT family transporter n=1 Tax=Aquirufa sp. TaxID=2676249 RepID=UPI0037BF6566
MRKKIHQIWYKNKGIGFMLLSSLCFALMSALAKSMSERFSSVELVFFRSAVGLPFLLISLYRRPGVQKGGKLYFIILRGLLGAFTLYCLFYTLEHLGLSLTNTYGQAFPLFIAIFSFLIFPSERLSGRQVFFLFVGFLGILLIFQPEATGEWFNHATGIIYAMGTALGYLAIKEAQKYYDSRWVVVSFMGAGLIASTISLCLGTIGKMPNSFFTGYWVTPTAFEWLKALVMGLLALGVQYYTTQALLHEKTSIVGAVGNSAVLFSIAIEIALGHGLPSLLVCAGMGLVVWGSYRVSR